jgi:hypothetical protein
VVFGGLLNEDFDGSEMPLDVTEHLRELGIAVCLDPADLASVLSERSVS